MSSSDLINNLQEITGTKEFGEKALPTEDNGIYHDLVNKTTEDDGVTPRAGEGVYGSIKSMYSLIGDTAQSAQDALDAQVLTAADVVLTHADVLLTNADAASTSADVISSTAQAAIATNEALAASTSASNALASENAMLANESLAQEWAENPEDTEITGHAGSFSSLHYSNKALEQSIIATTKATESEAYATATALDASATAANVILTAADVVSTSADSAQTALDVISTAADAVSTNLDKTQTALDVLATAADAASTASDVLTTDAAKVAAQTAQAAVELIFDTYDDRFLGTKSSEPTLDNDGDPLIVGAVFYDSTATSIKFYNGTSWDAPDTSSATSAQAAVDSAAAALVSEGLADADRIQTNADRAQTSLDVIATALSESNAAASALSASTNAAQVAADLVNTNQDSIDTASDLVATSQDVIDSNAAKDAAIVAQGLSESARDSAVTAADLVDDLVLGAFTSALEPTTDSEGAIYYNTDLNQLKVWSGVAWDDAAFSTSGAVTSFNTREGAVTLNATDINTALGFTAVELTKTNVDALLINASTVNSLTVETAVPPGAVFTDNDTVYDDTAISGRLDTLELIDHDHSNKAVLDATTASYTIAEEAKLSGIEALAEVNLTDAETSTLMKDYSESLTNKTIVDSSNHIHANALQFTVYNATAGIITKGTPVTITEHGANGIEVAVTNQSIMVASGIASEDIAISGTGLVISTGEILGINTEDYAEGMILYVNGGTLTNIEPTSGFSQPIAVVLKDAVDGIIQVLAAYPKQDAADVRFVNTTSVEDKIGTMDTAIGLNTAKESNVTTDLSASIGVSSVIIESSDGTDATIGQATSIVAGVMTTAHHDKLDGIADNATANVVSDSLGNLSTTDALSASRGKFVWDALNTHIGSENTLADTEALTISGTSITLTKGDATTDVIVIPDGVTDHTLLSNIGSNTHTQIDTFIGTKGSVNGLAELDASGLVPSAQLPSYVDDVLEYANFAGFPGTGETGKIYIAIDTNLTYRWSGSVYVTIASDLALGETASTAYRGDRGKIAYDHSQVAHAPSGADNTAANETSHSDVLVDGDVGTIANKLVQLNGSAQLPAVDGSLLTGITPAPTAIKTANYTAIINDNVICNTTSAVFTVTLPISPTTGDIVVIQDIATSFGTNNLTVARNGQTIMGLAEDILLDVNDLRYEFIFLNNDWRVSK